MGLLREAPCTDLPERADELAFRLLDADMLKRTPVGVDGTKSAASGLNDDGLRDRLRSWGRVCPRERGLKRLSCRRLLVGETRSSAAKEAEVAGLLPSSVIRGDRGAPSGEFAMKAFAV